MDSDKIGIFIKQLRTDKKISQYQLADMIPISRQAVSKWERGKTIPDSSTLLRLSEIFDVTINELLLGERLNNNSIESLEKTTLEIVDESNKITKKMKRVIFISITIIISLILIFLAYYFINSYNTIKVYKIYGESKNFVVYEGMMINLKEKSYFNLGKIKEKNNKKINYYRMYYKIKNKKIIIIEINNSLDKIVSDYYGYSKKVTINDYSNIINNTYIEINYDNNKKENFKLNFKRDFTNNNLLFEKRYSRKKDDKVSSELDQNNTGEALPRIEEKDNKEEEEINEEIENTSNETVETMMEKAIEKSISNESNNNVQNSNELEEKDNSKENDEKKMYEDNSETKLDIIKKKGINNVGTYVYEIPSNNIKFIYFSMMNQVMMYKNDEIEWTYLHYTKIYQCNNIPNGNPNNEEECKKYVNYCLNFYIK